MNIPRKTAVSIGLGALVFVAILQTFNSVVCYKQDVGTYLGTLMFIAVPMLPAIISLKTKNPLRAVGGSLLFAPWLVFAYYTDCVRPYTGGGASMIYVAVAFWGLLSAAIGTALTGPVLALFGVSVNE